MSYAPARTDTSIIGRWWWTVDRWLLAARGSKGPTAEVYFAFGQDFTRSTLQVLGSDGSIEVDLHHNLSSQEEKTPWLEFWNTFLAGWRRGKELKRSARRGACSWFLQTLGLGQRQGCRWRRPGTDIRPL